MPATLGIHLTELLPCAPQHFGPRCASLGGAMSVIERLLVPGCTELPECRCGKEMQIVGTHRLPKSDAEIRVYNCPACHHEMRLTVWANDTAA
jgi:hypothetical protein